MNENEIMKKLFHKFYLIGKEFSKETNECHISAYASSVAFFMMLSIIPILIMVCAIIPYTPITQTDIIDFISDFMPNSFIPMASSTIADVYDSSPAIISVSAIVALWSGGKGMMAIYKGLNAIHRSYDLNNYFLIRIRSCVYTILLIILILFVLIIGVFGEFISHGLESRIPGIVLFTPLFYRLRILLIFIALCLFFLLLFTFIPNTKIDWRTQIIGAIFVGVTWSGFSFAFSIYVKYFTGTSIYGSMTTIILLMFWFYSTFYLMFLGAVISKFLTPAILFLIDRKKNRVNE